MEYDNVNVRQWKITTRGHLGIQLSGTNANGKDVTLATGWREVAWSGAASTVAGIAAVGATLALF